ncbi:MAG: hypothetical protein BroJett018_09950 [Chloroflexota bacterium]|nr:hypothetical protein [Chloroflexota bacterium]NOG62590.1 hypothetical protein [Chloroflexota bacterium]GIK63201.1 MAG: hypothetical protein BroJett018_09950 [Chloroflexota bacterium]
MNKRRVFVAFLLVALLSVGLFSAANQPAKAHEGRQVGPYTIELGWVIEPAYAGVYNGVEVHISTGEDEHTDEATDEHAEAEVIEANLQIEVSFGNASKVLDLEMSGNEANHYIAAIIPTRAGDYTFHLTGTIGETPVDEIFSSADGEFSSVEPISDVLFPEPEASIEGLQNRISQLEALIAELQAQLTELQGQ